MIFIFAVLAEAWNILAGYTGQFSLANAIFFGVGAYTSSVLLLKFSINPWIGLLIGGLFAVILAIIIGLPVFRLQGKYFVIATLVAGEALKVIFQNWNFIGAQIGLELPIMMEDSLKNMNFVVNKKGFYYITLGMVVLTVVILYFLLKSKLGYYFKMIREEEDVAQSIGVNVRAYKLVSISMTAFLTAIAGTVYAQYLLYINPEMVFSSNLSIKIVLIAALGGVGTILGPIMGAFILVPLTEGTRILYGGSGRGIDWLLYGVLLLIIVLFRPGGIITFFQKKT